MNTERPTTGPTGLEICQRQRDEIREERDALAAEAERLRAALEQIAYAEIDVDGYFRDLARRTLQG